MSSAEGSSADPVVRWTVDDSGLDSYAKLVYFEAGSAIDVIKEHMQSLPNSTGIDIAGGSNGIAIRQCVELGIVSQGVFTNHFDVRDATTKESGLHFIEGDLLVASTWEAIKNTQRQVAPEGFGLALHRPFGALQSQDLSFYSSMASKVIDMLKPRGIFFMQIPSHFLWPRSKAEIQLLTNSIQSNESVLSVEESDRKKTLSDYAFYLITKQPS